jgi:hypothetical protein
MKILLNYVQNNLAKYFKGSFIDNLTSGSGIRNRTADPDPATHGCGSGTRFKITCLDGVESLPDHGHNRARGHVGDEAGKEGLLGEVGVVLLQVLLGGLQQRKYIWLI